MKTRHKKIVARGFIVIGMILLLYLMTMTYYEIHRSTEGYGVQQRPLLPLLLMSLWGFLFGVLIEWKLLVFLFKGYIRISWMLLPTFMLTIVVFIPRLYWLEWFGVGGPFFIEMLWKPEIQMLLTVFSGILFVRSLAMKIET